MLKSYKNRHNKAPRSWGKQPYIEPKKVEDICPEPDIVVRVEQFKPLKHKKLSYINFNPKF